MKIALFFLGALIFATFVQAEDSRITNFKNRSKREDWLIEFEVKEEDYQNCRSQDHDVCLSAGIYTPEITIHNQIIFKGIGSSRYGDNSQVGLALQVNDFYSTNVFLPGGTEKYLTFFGIINGYPQQINSIFQYDIEKTDVISGNYGIQLASSANRDVPMNILWVYLPDLQIPEQGTKNDNDDSESSSSSQNAVIALLILAMLL